MTDPGAPPPPDPTPPRDPGALPPQPIPASPLPTPTGSALQGIVPRLQRILRNENGVFAEIGADSGATVPALIVAGAASLIANLFPVRIGSWIGAIIGGVIAAVVGAGIFWLLSRIFKGNGEYIHMLRATGFAMAPQALGIIPIVGGIVGLLWSIWLLVKAVKETQHTTEGGAWATVLIPAAVFLLLALLLFAALFAAFTGVAISNS